MIWRDVTVDERLCHAYVMLCCTACAAWHCMCWSLAGTNMGVLLDHKRTVTPAVQRHGGEQAPRFPALRAG
jgi:hypothetical protein